MINCEKAGELANGYIDNMLDEADCTAYEEHIACCEKCHEEYDILKQIAADLARTASPLPEGFKTRMHTALAGDQLQFRGTAEKKKFAFPYYRTASVVAAALVITVVGKYGIFDTYKTVTEEPSYVTTQNKTEDTPTGAADNKVKSEEIKNAEIGTVENAPSEEKKQVKEDALKNTVFSEQSNNLAQEERRIDTSYEENRNEAKVQIAESTSPDPTPASEPVAIKETAADTSTPSEASVPADTEAEVTDTTSVMSKMRMMDESAAEDSSDVGSAENQGIATASVEADTEVTEINMVPASGGGSSSPEKKEAALIPAEVSIYSDGDGSKLMFKKYLYTIVEHSQIEEKGEEIVVTINEEEYENVMEHLRSNEYVKSVTEGSSFEGKAVINIK